MVWVRVKAIADPNGFDRRDHLELTQQPTDFSFPRTQGAGWDTVRLAPIKTGPLKYPVYTTEYQAFQRRWLI